MIEADPSVTIINKDHVIATLTEDVPFEMTLSVDKGRGYVTAPTTSATPRSRRSA
jgi:DNA-directed RNA polymerase subunit alpha